MTEAAQAGDRQAAGDEQTDIDPVGAEQALADDSSRGKKKLYDWIRETLPKDTRNYAVAPVLGEKLSAVFDGDGLTSAGGAPEVVGEFLVRLHSLLAALDAQVLLTMLDFSSSVVIELQPLVPESVEVQARDLAETDPDGLLRRRDLDALIPTSVVAANAAVRLLESSTPEQGLRQARRYGQGVADAYVSLARSVAKRDGTLRMSGPGEQVASLKAPDAERIVTASLREEPLEPRELTIVGTLTRTDSEEARFRVVLDRERLPPELDGRRRVVEGRYSDDARVQVEENGLWNQRVIAKVLAQPVRGATKVRPAFKSFEFVSLRRAAG